VRAQADRTYRIGVLAAGPRPTAEIPTWAAFLSGLRDLGYAEGRNLVLENRFAEGRLERLPELAAGLVAARVDVIVVAGPAPMPAAKAATATVPIVMIAGSGDPVGEGLVASLARPGGNITGLTFAASSERYAKQLELLNEAAGRIARVAFLWDGDEAYYQKNLAPALDQAAHQLGIRIIGPVLVHSPGGLEAAFAAMVAQQAQAILAATTGVILSQRVRAAALAIQHRLPMMVAFRELVAAGSLMSYGPNFAEVYRRAAVFIDKILKGARPADIPVEQPPKYDMIVNLATARALGLAIPPAILARADEVIE
jgi:putative ABC transport system substrate-binding protein